MTKTPPTQKKRENSDKSATLTSVLNQPPNDQKQTQNSINVLCNTIKISTFFKPNRKRTL